MNPSPYIDELIDAWNSHSVDRITAFYAPDCTLVDVGQPAPQCGLEAVRQSILYYLNAAPDVQLTCDDLFVDGTRLVVVWTAQGTHQGKLMRIPPTGRSFTVSGVAVLHLHDDKITYAWCLWDIAQLLRHIGLLPEL